MKSKALNIASLVLGLLAIGFFATTLYTSWRNLNTSDFHPETFWIIPILLFITATGLSAFLWKIVVKILIKEYVSTREASVIHFGSWVMRYVPTLGSVAYKSIWLVSKGFRVRIASVPIVFEGLYVFTSSFIVGIALLTPVFIGLESAKLFLFGLILILIVSVGISFLLSIFARNLLRLSKEESGLVNIRPWEQTQLHVSYLVPRLINGVGVIIVSGLFGSKDLRDSMAVGGVFLIAEALGFLVPVVPSGLGIREGVFISSVVVLGWQSSDALTLSILLRFLTTISDVAIAGLWIWLRLDFFSKTNLKWIGL